MEVAIAVHLALKVWIRGVEKPPISIQPIGATCEKVSESLVAFDLIDNDTKQAVNEHLEGIISESIQGR